MKEQCLYYVSLIREIEHLKQKKTHYNEVPIKITIEDNKRSLRK